MHNIMITRKAAGFPAAFCLIILISLVRINTYRPYRLPELPELTESTITSIQLQGPLVEQVDLEGNSTQVRNSTVFTATHAEDDSTAVSWRSGGANITDAPSLRALLEDLEGLKEAE